MRIVNHNQPKPTPFVLRIASFSVIVGISHSKSAYHFIASHHFTIAYSAADSRQQEVRLHLVYAHALSRTAYDNQNSHDFLISLYSNTKKLSTLLLRGWKLGLGESARKGCMTRYLRQQFRSASRHRHRHRHRHRFGEYRSIPPIHHRMSRNFSV
jgi:hypothetical protein